MPCSIEFVDVVLTGVVAPVVCFIELPSGASDADDGEGVDEAPSVRSPQANACCCSNCEMVDTIEKTRIVPIKLAMAIDPFPDLILITFLGCRLFVTIFRESLFLIRFMFCFVNNINAFVCNILLKLIPKLCPDYSQINPNSSQN